jgi:sugar O-acyltransferase (sialic acid O-acetyltransferase NeuD family)
VKVEKEKKLIIVGAGEFAEIAYEYFTMDSPFEVVAFSVNEAFIKEKTLFGLPIVPFEKLESYYSPQEHSAFVAVTFTQLTRVRTKLYEQTKAKKFPIASFVWHNAKIGENCFIFENNVIQYHVNVGNNVIMWSGNHIGHRSTIGENTFLSSHVVISGYCKVGKSCFFGVNSTLGDTLSVGDDCVVGAGAVLVRNADENKIYIGNPARVIPMGSREKFKVAE